MPRDLCVACRGFLSVGAGDPLAQDRRLADPHFNEIHSVGEAGQPFQHPLRRALGCDAAFDLGSPTVEHPNSARLTQIVEEKCARSRSWSIGGGHVRDRRRRGFTKVTSLYCKRITLRAVNVLDTLGNLRVRLAEIEFQGTGEAITLNTPVEASRRCFNHAIWVGPSMVVLSVR